MDAVLPAPAPGATPEVERLRRRAGYVSLLGGTAVFAIKLLAWQVSGSTAALSDALESIVNIVAAGFAIFAIRFAAIPADRDHPYGHGKIEHLAAAFEGGLISFAAVMIFFAAGTSLWTGVELREVDLGLAALVVAGVLNLILGSWILRVGRQTDSPTLVADGQHVLADVWTTLGVLLGLGLARVTGLEWMDPLVALAIGALLARTGFRLVGDAAHGLLDREDPALLARLVDAFNDSPVEGLTNLHRLRAIRSGDLVHADAHVFVPAHWTVERAHEAMVELERRVSASAGFQGELALHLDPCHPGVCSGCDHVECPMRSEPFRGRVRLTVEAAVGPSRLGERPR
ncbi:MAG TPA: cation diffusion facilitator family transporter [Vulgatibacter sp.]|nr:cation diffusion facilitator family transporter [Vulgatibacter sp.]